MNRCFLLPLSFSTSAHSIFCWPFHSGHTPRRWSLVCFWHRHHQHWAVERLFVQWRYSRDKLSVGGTLRRHSELPATAPSGFWLFDVLYPFLEIWPPAHCRASAHFFSVISRLRCARDLGSGIARAVVSPCN